MRCVVRFLYLFTIVLIVTGFTSSLVRAQPAMGNSESEDTLADEVNDPVAHLTQLPLKDAFTPAQYGTNAQPNTLQLRSVLVIQPHLFTPLEQLLRPTVQVVTVPRGKGSSTTTALDDFQLLDLVKMPFPDPKRTGFMWGLGPYFVFPTSTSQLAGNGAWQMGPAGAFSWQFQHLKVAALVQQATSFAYTSSRSKSVASLQIQPILSYSLGHGFYLKSSDATWKVNLRRHSSTTIPLSAGVGKVWKTEGGYSINFAISGEWMVYRQYETQTEQFTINFQLSLLLPRLEM